MPLGVQFEPPLSPRFRRLLLIPLAERLSPRENQHLAETRQLPLLGDQENQDYCLLRKFSSKRRLFRSFQPCILDIKIAGLRPNFGFFLQYSD